jgi:hypothetical protein
MSLLNEWFQRSGVCPLTINIVFHNEDDWTNEIAHDLINLLVQQAYRWRSINLVLPEPWYPFLECIKDNVNQLTTVSAQPLWADCGLSPSKRKRLTIFENAPLLTYLHLNGYYLTDVFLRWSQLTRITLQHVYLDECFYALPLTPNLTWCRIYTILINDVNRTVVDPDRPIVLDKLKKFIVYSAAWGDLMRLLSSLSCVRLESFEISALFDDLVFPQLSSVLPRLTTDGSHPSSLTRLVLSELDFTSRPAFQVEPELKALLRDLPMLEELEIEVSRKADRENSAFCSWWLIDLLGVQEPGTELVEHAEGKERGRLEMGSRNSDGNGKCRSFGRPSSRAKSLRETPPTSPCYILPNLRSFTFSGVVIAHTCIASDDTLTSTANEPTDRCSFSFPHPASFHLPARVRKNIDLEFPQALLEVLSTRGGFGSEWLDSLHAIAENAERSEEATKTLDSPPTSKAQNDNTHVELKDTQKIYFLDDEDTILALPADILPEPQSSSISTTSTTTSDSGSVERHVSSSPIPTSLAAGRLPAKSTPLNLRNSLETFNLRATAYKPMSGGPARTTKGGWRTSVCCKNGASNEVKAGLRRLVEDGGMKMKVAIGVEGWV